MVMNFTTLIPYICAPYLPLLGPIRREEITADLLKNIYMASLDNKTLPYDKHVRWSDKPYERITQDGINIIDGTLVIETTSARTKRLYVYGKVHSGFLSSYSGFELITISAMKPAIKTQHHTSAILLDDLQYSSSIPYTASYAHELSSKEVSIVATLGDEDSMSGFRHLINSGAINDPAHPVIITRRANRIVGAIGPHQTLTDSRGVQRLLPCYFGVSASARRQGVGNELWHASRQWATTHGAAYSILQAELSSDAEHFYESIGLEKLGYVTKCVI